ncbi:MAG: hypothetical protein JXA20_02360 [Spirochaetes bacterium]|nr:hypothetical protein [Spirochaetota bacterium]
MRAFGLALFIVLMALTPSCYLVNTERGTSRIMLAQTLPAGVTALHVAVYQGTAADENLLSYQVFYQGQSVNMTVPGGSARIFVIWGEGSTPGIVTHCGAAGPVNVASDSDMEVPVAMQLIEDSSFQLIDESYGMKWEQVNGINEYELQYQPGYSGPFQTVYVGPGTVYYTTKSGEGDWRIRGVSRVFNLTTVFYGVW